MDRLDQNNIKWILGREPLAPEDDSTNVRMMSQNDWERIRVDPVEMGGRLQASGEGLSCRRLGHYFEALAQKMVAGAPGVEHALFNQQIYSGNDTLGEADLIIKLKNVPRPLHVEMALKFYLHDPSRGMAANSLVGPDPRDNLPKKWLHLSRQQLALSDLAQFKDTAPAWAQNPERIALFLGRVFACLDAPNGVPKDSFSLSSLSGNWIHHGDARLDKITDEETVILTDRREWLSDPVERLKSTGSFQQKKKFIAEHFEQTNFALMLLNYNERLPRRIVIVPAGWPDMKPPIRPIYESRKKDQ